MNKSNAHLYLPLVQALATGKTIQYSASIARPAWFDKDELGFASDAKYYRIKPKPVERWIAIYEADQKGMLSFMSKESCLRNCADDSDFVKAIKLVEQI